jgi:hypothetical protein
MPLQSKQPTQTQQPQPKQTNPQKQTNHPHQKTTHKNQKAPNPNKSSHANLINPIDVSRMRMAIGFNV